MTADIATLGIALDSRPVTEGTKALDALGDASVRVEQKIKASNGQMNDTAKIMAAQAKEARDAAIASGSLSTATERMTLGQQLFIDKLRDQVATLGMSRSQLLAYQAAELGVTQQTQELIAKMKAYEDQAKASAAATRAAAEAKVDAANKAGQLTDAIKILTAAYALFKVGEYIKESAMLAARYETLGVVMEVVGRNAGYTKIQMITATEAIAKQGITMVESRESAVKLVQAHVDLKNATVLARIAQDAAVIGHMNSSDAFDRLVNGIARGNVLILRNIGINVNLQTAYRQMADELGKTTKELSENERVQARLNAVIERGTDIAGTYEAAMGTASKQITSMQRYTQDLKTTIGETFTEVLTVAVMSFTNHLKDANGEVSEMSKSGQLAEWGRDLTGIFVGVANAIDNIVTGVKMAGTWAAHQSAGADINKKFDMMQTSAPQKATLGGAMEQHDMIERQRAAAFAKEKEDYEKSQVDLAGTVDRFQHAADERAATRMAKQKAEADARLKVDADYAAASQALMVANAGKSLKIQQDAQKALADSVYVGTPKYRDTEGREAKPKADAVENTQLADHIARLEKAAAAEKQHYDDLQKLDEMYHKAGELSDAQYFAAKRVNFQVSSSAQIQAYDDEIVALQKHHSVTAAENAKHQKELHDIEDKRTAAKDRMSAENFRLDEEERLRQKAIAAASDDANNKYLSGLEAQLKAVEAANGKREKSASLIAAETAMQLRQAAALMSLQASGPAEGGHTKEDAEAAASMLVTLNLQAEAQERIAAALQSGEAAAASRKLAEQAIQDWQRVGQTISDALTSAFSAAGNAAGGMFKAYADNTARQIQLENQLTLAKAKLDDDPSKLKTIADIKSKSAQAQIHSYGDMASAAKGFFKENSTGYKVMEGAEKAYRVAEMAMAVESMLTKSGLLTAFTGLFITSKATEAAATVATVPVTVGAEAAKQTALATTAMAGAVAVPFPGNIAAFGIVAAMLAAIGLGGFGGGGGGVSVSQERQAAAGTGSILGDSSAKSASISRAVELAAANSNIELTHTAGMLRALLSIESNIGSFTNVLVRNGSVTSKVTGEHVGSAEAWTSTGDGKYVKELDPFLGGFMSKVSGKILGTIFGGKVTAQDTGIMADKTTVGQIASSGVNVSQYTDYKKSGGWFHSDKYNTDTKSVGSDANDQFAQIFAGMAKGVSEAGKLLGLGGDAFTAKLNSFVVDLGKISTKDLSADAIQKQLEAVFSKTADDMARWTVAGLAQFIKVGEGSFETLVRIAADYANLDSVLESVGMTFGAVGMNSIAAREHLIDLAGGIDDLASKMSSFANDYLTEAERLAPVAKYVATEMSALGLAGVTTRDQFKDVVLGLNLTTDAGQQQYVALMALESAFAKVHAAAVDLTKSQQEIADERADLQNELDELTMSQAQLLNKQRMALDASNRGLFDQIQGIKALKEAQDASKASLGDVTSHMKSFGESATTLKDSLLMGSLTTLTPEQQYAEARRQRDATRAAALGGDVAAQGQLSAMQTAFLTISQKVNGGDAQYSADFAGVLQMSDEIAKWSAGQVDVAQASLDALNAQVLGIADLNATMAIVAQAVIDLPAALSMPPPVMVGVPDYRTMGTTDMAPLVAEIKALREQVVVLTKNADKNTGNLIAVADQVAKRSDVAIVEGVGTAVRVRTTAQNSRTNLE